MQIKINDADHMMHLAYIDDVVSEFIDDMEILTRGGSVKGIE